MKDILEDDRKTVTLKALTKRE